MLKRLAKTDGDLEAALAPIDEQFFEKRSPAVIAEENAKKEPHKAANAAKAAAAAKPAPNSAPST